MHYVKPYCALQQMFLSSDGQLCCIVAGRSVGMLQHPWELFYLFPTNTCAIIGFQHILWYNQMMQPSAAVSVMSPLYAPF